MLQVNPFLAASATWKVPPKAAGDGRRPARALSGATQLMRLQERASDSVMIRVLAIVLLCLLIGDPLLAAEGPLPRTPIYNSASKSYFQLFDDNEHPGNWEAARARAGMKAYKGVRGRLAVVDSPETHEFLLKAFSLDQRHLSVWIGLRYWCSARLLQWEEGRPFSPSEPDRFRLWHTEWSRSDENACSFSRSAKVGFAPVYYRTIGGLTRWQAVGAAKYFSYYLVEFPTGGE